MNVNKKVFERIKATRDTQRFNTIVVLAESHDVKVTDIMYEGKSLLETFELKEDGTTTKAKVSGCINKPSSLKAPGSNF